MKTARSIRLGVLFTAVSVLIMSGRPAVGQVLGQLVTVRSFNFSDRYIRHRDFLGEISPIVTSLDRADATFRVITGLADSSCISFESSNFPGHYLRHESFRLRLHQSDGTALFRQDATFCSTVGLAGRGAVSFRSYNFPGRYIRHRNFELWVDEYTSTPLFHEDATFWFILDTPP
jgi:hypothetical protein